MAKRIKNIYCPYYSSCLMEWAKKDINPTCDMCRNKYLRKEKEDFDVIGMFMLWASVLKRAVEDYKKEILNINNTRQRKLFIHSDILNWFLSEEVCVGSFRWICEILNIDYKWFLEQLSKKNFSKINIKIKEKQKSHLKMPKLMIK